MTDQKTLSPCERFARQMQLGIVWSIYGPTAFFWAGAAVSCSMMQTAWGIPARKGDDNGPAAAAPAGEQPRRPAVATSMFAMMQPGIGLSERRGP